MPSFEELRAHATFDREPFFRLAASYIKPSMRVLDVGAGDGSFARSAGTTNIYLLEGNPASAVALKKDFANVIEMSLPGAIPVPDGYFNLIHSSHVIEHFYHRDLYDVMTELDRCLADDGYLIISTPLLYDGFYDDFSHVKPYSPVVLYSYLCGANQNQTRTAKPISIRYRQVELKWRWRLVPVPYFNISYSWRRLQRLLHGVTTLLRRVNFGYYQVTGYTIVLQKLSRAGAQRS